MPRDQDQKLLVNRVSFGILFFLDIRFAEKEMAYCSQFRIGVILNDGPKGWDRFPILRPRVVTCSQSVLFIERLPLAAGCNGKERSQPGQPGNQQRLVIHQEFRFHLVDHYLERFILQIRSVKAGK